MKPWTSPITFILFAGMAFAQQPSPPQSAPKAAPSPSGDAMGSELIAWSDMQKPRPVAQNPQPVPPPESRAGQSQNTQPAPTQDGSQTPNQQQPEPATNQAAQSLTGTIMKAAGKFVLQTADSTAYMLDDQDKAKSYEGKRVRVTGTLDRPTGLLRVSSIELLS